MKKITRPVLASLSAIGLLAVMSMPARAQSGSRNAPPSGSSRRTSPPVGSSNRTQVKAPLALEGYCPVSLKTMNKWVKGVPAIQTVFDGRKYHFANEQGKTMFLAGPAKYAPVLGGDCVVSLVKMGKRVRGDIRHAARHKERLFLFANEGGQKMFLANQQQYVDADLAYGGKCVVCRAEMKQSVPGKPEFIVFHNGLRYLFPNAKMQGMFLANPQKYAVAATGTSSATPGSSSRRPAASGSSSR